MPTSPRRGPTPPLTLGSDGEAQDLRAFLSASAEFGEQFGADFNAAHVPSANLPRKSLPPGCPKDYYFLYRAEAEAAGHKKLFGENVQKDVE